MYSILLFLYDFAFFSCFVETSEACFSVPQGKGKEENRILPFWPKWPFSFDPLLLASFRIPFEEIFLPENSHVFPTYVGKKGSHGERGLLHRHLGAAQHTERTGSEVRTSVCLPLLVNVALDVGWEKHLAFPLNQAFF